MTHALRWILVTFFIFTFILGTSFITITFALSLAGFWASVIAMILSWFFLCVTGFYYLESVLANPPGSNVTSLSERYMSKGGAWFSSVVFALVNYGYLVFFFYLASPLLVEMATYLGFSLNYPWAVLLLALLIGIPVFCGLTVAAFMNFFFTLVMCAILYFSFAAGMPTALSTPIPPSTWSFLMIVFPAVLNSLYFNTFIPTVAPLVKYQKKSMQSSILVAMTVAALIFILWLWLTITTANDGVAGLGKLNPEAINFANLNKVPYFGKWLPYLLCLNVVTTGLGVSATLIDYFGDLFKIPLERRRGLKRLSLTCLTFIPPLLLSFVPRSFVYLASIYVTDIGPLYLSGLLPVLWVWALRYFFHDKVPPLVPGGKVVTLLFAVLSCFVFYLVGLEIFYQRTFAS